jgi:hypothetical protein
MDPDCSSEEEVKQIKFDYGPRVQEPRPYYKPKGNSGSRHCPVLSKMGIDNFDRQPLREEHGEKRFGSLKMQDFGELKKELQKTLRTTDKNVIKLFLRKGLVNEVRRIQERNAAISYAKRQKKKSAEQDDDATTEHRSEKEKEVRAPASQKSGNVRAVSAARRDSPSILKKTN